LKNNHIDLTNDDAGFSPKQRNKNNTHKGLNSNLQLESQQSINSERDVVFFRFYFQTGFFGLAFTKTGKPSLGNCLLSSPETRS
jgi:hypothetical protein